MALAKNAGRNAGVIEQIGRKGMGVAIVVGNNRGSQRQAGAWGRAVSWVLWVMAAMILLGMGSPARAEPWAPVNDIQLKNDLTTLKEYGVIPGNVTTWSVSRHHCIYAFWVSTSGCY